MSDQITGKRRYRMGGLFRTKLILQVQIVTHDYSHYGDHNQVFHWRDARVQDLMSIEACHRPFPVEGRAA
jgi:hypothetical protein